MLAQLVLALVKGDRPVFAVAASADTAADTAGADTAGVDIAGGREYRGALAGLVGFVCRVYLVPFGHVGLVGHVGLGGMSNGGGGGTGVGGGIGGLRSDAFP